MKIRAILNPRAGLASKRALAAMEASARWREADVKITQGPGDARRFAEEAAAQDYDAVLALGGDGTANETAWGLLGSRTALGLLPAGSGNGLARTLRIPLRPELALKTLEDVVVRPIDVGLANGRPFLNVAGAGFDAVVGNDFHEHGRAGGRRGVWTYVRLGLRRSMSYRAEAWTLAADAHRFEGRALVVAFVNGRQYGGGATIAPGAYLDDGLLDVVVIEDASRFSMVWNATRMFTGSVERIAFYRHMAAASARLQGTSPLLHHRDGEPEDAVALLEVTVSPKALQLLVPRATALDPKGPFKPS
jgi:diacylglycerol kinase (ATP)